MELIEYCMVLHLPRRIVPLPKHMRWSPEGAHNVVVARADVLDGRLAVADVAIAA